MTINSQQKGFSALGLFLLGLVLLVIMSATGFFNHPISEVTDKTLYNATGTNGLKSPDGLHMTDLNFDTPTPQPTTPAPTTSQPVPVPSSCTPPAGGNYCAHDTERIGCICNPCLPVGLYCGGNMPPAPASCMTDSTVCQQQASSDPSCHWYCLGKPVIYLYPPKPIFVTVTVGADIVESIPPYRNGWNNVLAMPGGILKYNDSYYRELYYESSVKNVTPPDNGMFIQRENLKQELSIQTQKLGLSSFESQEFVDYWLPKLQDLGKKYIFFSVLSGEEKTRTDNVTISPKPDVFIQFIAYFKGVDEIFPTKPFTVVSPPIRTGFTAVEWGGTIDVN